MLWNASELNGHAIQATDGNLGFVSDILFDDASWTLRWLVVDTGNWLPGRQVLLPVSALGQPDRNLRILPINLTKQQVKDSPEIDTDKSVSRQHEAHIFDFYGLDPYWGGGLYPLSNAMAVPFLAPLPPAEHKPEDAAVATISADEEDQHLRSVAAVTGYHMHATDGQIGHAADFLVDVDTWAIRYIKVDTQNWWPGLLVLIAPNLVRKIDWAERLIDINADRQKVKGSPPYHADMTVDGAYDEKFMTYYTYSGSFGGV